MLVLLRPNRSSGLEVVDLSSPPPTMSSFRKMEPLDEGDLGIREWLPAWLDTIRRESRPRRGRYDPYTNRRLHHGIVPAEGPASRGKIRPRDLPLLPARSHSAAFGSPPCEHEERRRRTTAFRLKRGTRRPSHEPDHARPVCQQAGRMKTGTGISPRQSASRP